MTTEHEQSQSLIDLALKLVACPRFRWIPGMAVDDESPQSRVIEVRGGCIELAGYRSGRFTSMSCLPNLSDPLTCLAVLLLVHEAWGADFEIVAHISAHGASVEVLDECGERWDTGFKAGNDGLARALVEALVVAPAR